MVSIVNTENYRRPNQYKLNNEWTGYVLKCKGPAFYVGVTGNIERRLLEHFRGKGCRFTKRFAPTMLVELFFNTTKSVAYDWEKATIYSLRRSHPTHFIGGSPKNVEHIRNGRGQKCYKIPRKLNDSLNDSFCKPMKTK